MVCESMHVPTPEQDLPRGVVTYQGGFVCFVHLKTCHEHIFFQLMEDTLSFFNDCLFPL